MQEPDSAHFTPDAPAGLTLTQAIAKAREEMAAISDLPIDAVTRCERGSDGIWAVTLELVESVARMGDNDFLTAYELRFDPLGTLVQLDRIGRYRREDAGQP